MRRTNGCRLLGQFFNSRNDSDPSPATWPRLKLTSTGKCNWQGMWQGRAVRANKPNCTITRPAGGELLPEVKGHTWECNSVENKIRATGVHTCKIARS